MEVFWLNKLLRTHLMRTHVRYVTNCIYDFLTSIWVNEPMLERRVIFSIYSKFLKKVQVILWYFYHFSLYVNVGKHFFISWCTVASLSNDSTTRFFDIYYCQ